ncbi:hypothetical protein HA402_001691 [Bradysia odoriphaga]|nr:hypothetical protein HA402_001691 [Bradysia odoriphaga]
MEESLPTGHTKTSVSTWVDIARIPTIKQGQLFEDDKKYVITSEWSVDNLATKKSQTFVKCFTLIKPINGPIQGLLNASERILIATPPTPIESKLTCYSYSGKRKAVVVEIGTGGDAYDLLQIWNEDTLEKTYDLKELGSHKAVYTPGYWGTTMVWSPEENKLMYLAERKVKKSDPFWTSYARRKLDDPNATDKDNAERGREYDFYQNWGEQLENCYNSLVVVLSLDSDGFQYYTLPNNDFPCDLQWVGNSSFIGLSMIDSPWRLGSVYCANRESRVFQMDEHGHRYLSSSKRSALCPRVSPSQDYVIWQDREILGPHDSSRNILTSKIYPTSTDPRYTGTKIETVFRSGRDFQHGVPAVYDGFTKFCFSRDGNNVYLLTGYNARKYLLHIKRVAERLSIDVEPKFPTDVQAILSVTDDFLLTACSSSTKTPSLQLVDIKSGDFVKIPLSKSAPIYEPEPTVKILPTELPPEEIMPPSIYIEPQREGKIPLIVLPHGGPHGVLSDSFDHDTAYFTRLGFGVFKVNYTGSTGTRYDTTRNLNGHISKLDVPQVHQLVNKLIQSNPNIDSKLVFLCGGSHGGFIVLHLSSQYPEFYRGVVARNPVTDLNHNIGTTDITDWVYVEGGLSYDESKLLIPTVQNTADAEKLRLYSPVNLVHQVKCPTLLHLGTKDIRVPMSQGLIYYRTLLAHGKDVKLTIYDDNHALASTAVRANAKIEIAQFFNKISGQSIFNE